jgi:hypothetical protein
MVSCSDAMRALWEYLDATVDAATLDAIEEHSRCAGRLRRAGRI